MTASNHWLRVGVGELDPFFETGTEGVIWSLNVGGVPGYDGLLPLVKGDWVRVFEANGEVLWEGEVDLEYERRYRPYPGNPQYGQQEVQGFWVHGFQRTLDPEAWGDMFFKRRNAVVWRRAQAVSEGPGRLFDRGWQMAALRLGLSELPPHEQVLRLWDAVGVEGSPHAELCKTMTSSLLYALSHTVKTELEWSFSSVTEVLELDEEDTQVILDASAENGIIRNTGLSAQGTRRALAFLTLLSYFRFPGGHAPGWGQSADARALRHAQWRDVLLLLETWAPNPAKLRSPQD